ncbi:hypothetical protein [Rubrivivax rivuli]|uniref:Uncharacterized protein n=1 Tax=Rubrivivax rivuli TaxID=1862385 RepID=A0A437RRL3_9BURK|nr:hypothetical protein [Rubrivivax rivuli]RVU49434.1 hypothetical protein EOE66_02350 [Rubrivivax rivuli]
MTSTTCPLSPAQRLLAAAVHRLPACVLSQRWMQRLQDALQPHRGADTEAPVLSSTDQDDRHRGCGWFDSSLDLQQGLRVEEHTGLPGSDPALADLPLAAWLELQLQGWRPEPPGAQASAFTAVT